MSLGNRKKYFALSIMAIVVVVAAVALPQSNHEFKNLKVLPKNISSEKLSRIMIDDFEDGLGISCAFCHTKEKDSNRLDYASDEKPEKQVARLMMKMTMGINKKYFKLKHAIIGDSTLEINCVTCHNGQPHPEGQDSE